MHNYYTRELGVLSYSICKTLYESPFAYRTWLAGLDKVTPALTFGRAFDDFILTPEGFSKRWAIRPAGMRAGTKAHAEWHAENAGKQELSASDLETIDAMQKSLWLPVHKQYTGMLQDSQKQVEVHWTCKETGVKCRAKLDMLLPEAGMVVDLKTTAVSPGAREWERECSKRWYSLQAAVYLEAAGVAGHPCDTFGWLVAEKSPPHHWVLHWVTEDDLHEAKELWLEMKQLMARCLKTDSWPSKEGKAIAPKIWR